MRRFIFESRQQIEPHVKTMSNMFHDSEAIFSVENDVFGHLNFDELGVNRTIAEFP